MTIDKLNPDTWERTGRKTFDGAPVILNPVTGVQCVMPRPSWPNPRVPRNISQYVREARERGVEAATPEAMANSVTAGLNQGDMEVESIGGDGQRAHAVAQPIVKAAGVPAMMNCTVLAGYGSPEVLVPGKRPVPEPRAGEVLIKVAAAGINQSDVNRRSGRLNLDPSLAYDASERGRKAALVPGQPEIIGLDVAGTVVAVGSGVSSPQLGERVCALLRYGAYAEYAVAAAPLCLPIPSDFDMPTAAALPETFFTVWDCVFMRGRFTAGESILVHGGSSGIGTTTIMLAKAFGARRIFATVRDAQKAAICRELGCDTPILYTSEDFAEIVTRETEGRGVDVVFDMVGSSYFQRNLDCLAVEGRHLSIGTISGSKTALDLRDVMQKRLTISGSQLGARTPEQKAMIADDLRAKVWPRLGNGSGMIKPRIHATFPLAQAAQAHRLMETSGHSGKLILTI